MADISSGQDTDIISPIGQTTMAASVSVTVASNQTAIPTAGAGDVAHDAIDSGNPVKIGGKASIAVPTPVAAADRVNGWFDDYGRLVVSDQDTELGLSSGMTALRDKIVAQRCTVLSDSLADGISTFWTQAVANGGTIASTVGEGQLKTSTATNGSAQITSTSVVYYPGQVNWMNSAVRFGDTGVAGDIRRVGMFTVSGTTPQEGFYFELSGTTFNAVVVKAGVATAVASTSWSRFSVAPFTLDANYHSFEIRYTANSVWFYVDNVLRHAVSGTTTPLTTTLTLPITATNIKTSGATDIIFAIRNIGNGRFGHPGGVVAETGLSAVEAHAVGGGTPHDSVDSGNPLKIGGVAKTANPTAVADGDRVSAIFDKLGKQVVVGAIRDLKGKQVTTITSSTTETTIVTAVASTFLDLYGLILTNTSATVTKVTIRDATAGGTPFVIEVPATDTRGFMLPVDSAMPQTTVNNNWTATCGTSVASIEVTALFVKNT